MIETFTVSKKHKNKIKMAFRGLLRQQSRYFPMIFDLITSVTGTRSWMRSSESGTQIGTIWNANGTRMERKWNANGTQMEREWNANGTHLRTRSGRIPNAFSVRLFLSSTVIVDIELLDQVERDF